VNRRGTDNRQSETNEATFNNLAINRRSQPHLDESNETGAEQIPGESEELITDENSNDGCRGANIGAPRESDRRSYRKGI
jgi:hypothetical protein